MFRPPFFKPQRSRGERHCRRCDTEWRGPQRCWLCGRKGTEGRSPFVRMGGLAPGRTIEEMLG